MKEEDFAPYKHCISEELSSELSSVQVEVSEKIEQIEAWIELQTGDEKSQTEDEDRCSDKADFVNGVVEDVIQRLEMEMSNMNEVGPYATAEEIIAAVESANET